MPAPPLRVLSGPDGALWFTEDGVARIGRLTFDGRVTEFDTGLDGPADSLAFAPDGTLWFTQVETDQVGRMLPDGRVQKVDEDHGLDGWATRGIAFDRDGNAWIAESGTSTIRRIDAHDHAVTVFPIPHSFYGTRSLTLGADGNIWFLEEHAEDAKIGRITPAGVVTRFDLPHPGGEPDSLVAGRDGTLWFSEWHSNRIARVTLPGDYATRHAGR
ncbi:MAG: hypothetical protein JO197_11725 [Acidobacteria bacterium]|nr:hypothetical protein [Acidobacteriota bacterium]